MENMRSVLTAGDSSFAQVVKTTILLADIKDFRQWARAEHSESRHALRPAGWGPSRVCAHRFLSWSALLCACLDLGCAAQVNEAYAACQWHTDGTRSRRARAHDDRDMCRPQRPCVLHVEF